MFRAVKFLTLCVSMNPILFGQVCVVQTFVKPRLPFLQHPNVRQLRVRGGWFDIGSSIKCLPVAATLHTQDWRSPDSGVKCEETLWRQLRKPGKFKLRREHE